VQARIVAQHLSGGQGVLEPGADPAIHQVAHLEQIQIHLIAHLQAIAAIHEDGRAILEDHRRSGRAGEAGGPGQAVIGRGQVLVLVLVLVRGDETVQTLARHGVADQGQVSGAEGRIGVVLEGLAHGGDVSADGARCKGPPSVILRAPEASRAMT